MRLPLLVLFCCSLLTSLVRGEEPAAESRNRDLALQLTTQSAKDYRFQLTTPAAASDPPRGDDIVLRAQPILRWSNPERGEIYGNVFLWTQNGRPTVAGSLFKWYSPHQHMSHEFHSLATTGLTAKRGDEPVWTVEAPGVTYAVIPEAPAVADSAAARLTQMRQLSRQFSARATQRDGQPSDLRLLTQPVYRYELKPEQGRGEDLLDGGLFCFVEGTDPELWLLLEARRGKAPAAPAWHYAVARMNSITVEVQHQDKVVSRLETIPWREIYDHKQAYTSFRFD